MASSDRLLSSNKLLLATAPLTDSIYSLAYSPDSKLLAAGNDDNTIKLWEVATGKLLSTLSGHSDQVRAVAFSPDGTNLVSGDVDGNMRIWNIAIGLPVKLLKGHAQAVQSVRFSSDGKLVASSGADNTARVWEVATGKNTRTFTYDYKDDIIITIDFSKDNTRLITCDTSGELRQWKL